MKFEIEKTYLIWASASFGIPRTKWLRAFSVCSSSVQLGSEKIGRDWSGRAGCFGIHGYTLSKLHQSPLSVWAEVCREENSDSNPTALQYSLAYINISIWKLCFLRSVSISICDMYIQHRASSQCLRKRWRLANSLNLFLIFLASNHSLVENQLSNHTSAHFSPVRLARRSQIPFANTFSGLSSINSMRTTQRGRLVCGWIDVLPSPNVGSWRWGLS